MVLRIASVTVSGVMESNMKRLGTPGGMNFPFMVNEGLPNEAIVYAHDMIRAIVVWSEDINGTDPEPNSVRLMSDNE
jgi:hypothetical protein